MQPPETNPDRPSRHNHPESINFGVSASSPAPQDRQQRIHRFLIAGTITSGFCLLLTVAVPEDQAIARLLGFSRGRLALAGLLGLGTLIFLVLALLSQQRLLRKVPLLNRLAGGTDLGRSGSILLGLAHLGLFGSLYFLINGLNAPDFWQQPAQVRLAPFMLWVSLLSMLILNLLYGPGTRPNLPAIMQRSKGLILSFGLLSLIIVLLSTYLYVSSPELENAFIDEDAVVENLTAALFLWTGLVGGLVYHQNPRRARIWLVIPALGIWAFVEEISFGERIFNLEMPYLGGEKFDGLHDLFFLIYEGLRVRGLLLWAILGFLLAAIFIWRLIPGFRPRVREISKTIKAQPPLIFLSLAIAFVTASFILDLEFLEYRTGYFLEELVEFLGALALGFAALAMGWVVKDSEEH